MPISRGYLKNMDVDIWNNDDSILITDIFTQAVERGMWVCPEDEEDVYEHFYQWVLQQEFYVTVYFVIAFLRARARSKHA